MRVTDVLRKNYERKYLLQLFVQFLQRLLIASTLLKRADDHLDPRGPFGAAERIKDLELLLKTESPCQMTPTEKCSTMIAIAYPELAARASDLSADPGLEDCGRFSPGCTEFGAIEVLLNVLEIFAIHLREAKRRRR
jgi:hypothetical protein